MQPSKQNIDLFPLGVKERVSQQTKLRKLLVGVPHVLSKKRFQKKLHIVLQTAASYHKPKNGNYDHQYKGKYPDFL